MHMLTEKQSLSFKLMISLGIVHQLTDTWLSKALEPCGLNQSQFNLLNHFSHQPEREQTISQLAQVMQMNQPGLTKVVNKLAEQGLVDVRKDDEDGRKKWIKINANGLARVQSAFKSFLPNIDQCFDQWDDDEMRQMLQHTDKLKTWLDNNREPS
ncbi:MarR family winged helix-turn-helix transcriptional regulator [Enterovibrio sp. ZSDZ42]|uniref:MarR family winged helix-turn-helix transcriptional regulator n=1 Tax=Enterovibrio gelatinilyticus TaxID=2899819 RepID=A0ABT5R2E3_9GAMM|nr:MarR family winged helix-turn-helix transcriptional regulator [Enterovibrio sp. ZSDZ42]MDD1793916.1 MarR family winged helix-turn-helix transcriptional regulator [Enterovibrio sp. ZSDZ42]